MNRVKRAEDEPKCTALRQENAALMEQVISYKDKQMGFLQSVESLKQEKAALVAKKVRVLDSCLEPTRTTDVR